MHHPVLHTMAIAAVCLVCLHSDCDRPTHDLAHNGESIDLVPSLPVQSGAGFSSAEWETIVIRAWSKGVSALPSQVQG